MVQVKIDSFLRGEDLDGASSKNPREATIVNVKLIPAAELNFESAEDKYELRVSLAGEEFDWLANKTSLRAFSSAFGGESDAWIGKTIKLYSVEQNVGGKIKQVVYGIV